MIEHDDGGDRDEGEDVDDVPATGTSGSSIVLLSRFSLSLRMARELLLAICCVVLCVCVLDNGDVCEAWCVCVCVACEHELTVERNVRTRLAEFDALRVRQNILLYIIHTRLSNVNLQPAPSSSHISKLPLSLPLSFSQLPHNTHPTPHHYTFPYTILILRYEFVCT